MLKQKTTDLFNNIAGYSYILLALSPIFLLALALNERENRSTEVEKVEIEQRAEPHSSLVEQSYILE